MQVKVRQLLYVFLAMTLSLCFFLATAGVTYAQDFDGGYIGYNLGIANYNAGLDHDWEGGEHLENISNDFSYGLIGGYGMVKDNSYFSIEGNFKYNVADYEWNAGGKSNNYEQIEINETFGISGRLGYVVKNWLIYGLLGWQKTNINAELYYGTKYSEYSGKESFNGFRRGIGIEYQTSDNIFFRCQYSYTKYEEGTLSDNNVNFYIDHASNSQLIYGISF